MQIKRFYLFKFETKEDQIKIENNFPTKEVRLGGGFYLASHMMVPVLCACFRARIFPLLHLCSRGPPFFKQKYKVPSCCSSRYPTFFFLSCSFVPLPRRLSSSAFHLSDTLWAVTRKIHHQNKKNPKNQPTNVFVDIDIHTCGG
jgi:hypothetical protein